MKKKIIPFLLMLPSLCLVSCSGAGGYIPCETIIADSSTFENGELYVTLGVFKGYDYITGGNLTYNVLVDYNEDGFTYAPRYLNVNFFNSYGSLIDVSTFHLDASIYLNCSQSVSYSPETRTVKVDTRIEKGKPSSGNDEYDRYNLFNVIIPNVTSVGDYFISLHEKNSNSYDSTIYTSNSTGVIKLGTSSVYYQFGTDSNVLYR